MLVAASDDEEVAVLHSCVEADAAFVARVGCEALVEEVDEGCCLFGVEASAGVVLQRSAFDADEVAAQGEVVGLQVYAYSRGFKRPAAFVDEVLVVAEDAAIGYFGAWVKAIGDSAEHARASVCSKPVHGGRVGVLKQCLVAELCHVPVGHAVAQDDEVADSPLVLPVRE